MGKGKLKPPIPLEVGGLLGLARLILGRADSQALFWTFNYRSDLIIGSLFSIPYWKGNLPFFSFVRLEPSTVPGAYLAYKGMGSEEVFFTNSNEDPKYVYGVVIDAKEPPRVLIASLENGRKLHQRRPLMSVAKDLNSLVRLCYIMSDSYSSPPILRFNHKDRQILGALVPIFDYYDANALPIFVYVEREDRETGGFIRYMAVGGKEESSFVDGISDMKYYYARVVDVSEPPWWEKRRRHG
ncbi:MAG: hypothetical protein NZ920_05815 [Aigarchaeota archaeon]|nr:hypothetical protein [Aigarchaeota archaeon]MDW8092623.1 hypothetical protein [Nitrososphaerota archaeon]